MKYKYLWVFSLLSLTACHVVSHYRSHDQHTVMPMEYYAPSDPKLDAYSRITYQMHSMTNKEHKITPLREAV